MPAGSGLPGGPVGDLYQIEKGPWRPFRRSSGGPEGNRTPDLFHAKDAVPPGPSPYPKVDGSIAARRMWRTGPRPAAPVLQIGTCMGMHVPICKTAATGCDSLFPELH